MPDSGLRGQVMRGLAWESASKFIIQLASWAVTLVVAGLVGPADYGLVAISGLFTAALQLLGDYGITSGMVTARELNDSQRRSAFWFNIYLSAALYVLIFAAAPLLASLYNLPALQPIIRVAGLSLFITAARGVAAAQIMRDMDFRSRSLIDIAGQVLQALLTLLLALRGLGAWSLIWGYLGGQTLSTLLLLRKSGGIPRPTLQFSPIRDILVLGSRLTGARLIGYVLAASDTTVVSAMFGQQATGLYSMASQLAYMPMEKVGSIVSRVMFPTVARLSDDRVRAGDFFLTAHLWLLVVTTPVAVGTALIATDLVDVMFRAAWRDMAPILSVLCIAAVFRLSSIALYPVLEGLRKSRVLFWGTLASAPLQIAAFVIGARWGLRGLAIGWAVLAPFIWAAVLAFTLSTLQISLGTFIRSVQSVLWSLLAMTGVVLGIGALCVSTSPALRLVLGVVGGAATYAAVLAMLMPRERWTQARRLFGELGKS